VFACENQEYTARDAIGAAIFKGNWMINGRNVSIAVRSLFIFPATLNKHSNKLEGRRFPPSPRRFWREGGIICQDVEMPIFSPRFAMEKLHRDSRE
jgi:hypothetical protein